MATWPDGTLVREQSHAEVYVIFGGARFYIPNPEELTALGYTWSEVQVVSDGSLAPVGTIPKDGTLIRQRDQAPVYAMSAGIGIHLPTPDALVLMGAGAGVNPGFTSADVRIIPVGTIGQIPTYEPLSLSATPTSMVFGPDHPNHHARTELPGGVLYPSGAYVMEIRGWLREVDPHPNPSDPDWHMHLEVDPDWLAEKGINPGVFFKVSDILAFGVPPGGQPPWGTNTADLVETGLSRFVAVPIIHVELNGWRRKAPPNPPEGWRPNQLTDGTVWAYDPTLFSAGQYVSMVGSIVSDIPHTQDSGPWWWITHEPDTLATVVSDAYWSVAQAWDRGHDPNQPDDPARWTEIHPPDSITVIDPQKQKPQTSWYFGAALIAEPGILNPVPADNTIDVDLRPPTPQPPGTALAIEEHVGPETNLQTITEGNTFKNGAQISLYPDHAHIHVTVHGEPLGGIPGKFKAIYRLWWDAAVVVPVLSGKDITAAQQAATSEGLVFIIGTVNQRENVTGTTVQGQSPAPGTTVARGSIVTVTIVEPVSHQAGPGGSTGGRPGGGTRPVTP